MSATDGFATGVDVRCSFCGRPCLDSDGATRFDLIRIGGVNVPVHKNNSCEVHS